MSDTPDAAVEGRRILDTLATLGTPLTLKLYRLELGRVPDAPVLPCLDHEAMLHGGIPPHVAVYLQAADSGHLHELVFVPARRRIQVDSISTWGEHTPESQGRMVAHLQRTFPDYRVDVKGPSWWRGDRRVAEACRAHVSLRNVLLGEDLAAIRTGVDRLQTIGALMEKQSRVASWGVRTVTGPLLAAAGVVTFQVLGGLAPRIGQSGVTTLRSALIGLLGAVFLYYGLKAVQLTDMANRVWKRSVEYGLILSERRRLADAPGAASLTRQPRSAPAAPTPPTR